MPPTNKKKPANPLNTVKDRVKKKDYEITGRALKTADDDFGWDSYEVCTCFSKLNDLYHYDDRPNNHFKKWEEHRKCPESYYDHYIAYKLLHDDDVYTHLHIKFNTTKVIIDSFKRNQEL